MTKIDEDKQSGDAEKSGTVDKNTTAASAASTPAAKTTAKKTRAAPTVVADAEKTTRPDPDFASLTDLQELADCHNEMTITAIDLGLKAVAAESFPDVRTGVLACERLHAQIKRAREQKKETKVKKTTAAKSKANGSGGRARLAHDHVITWKGKGKENNGNPFREGGGRYERVELLRKHDGKTVEKFLAAGGRGGTVTKCKSDGIIKLTPPAKAPAAG